MKQIELFLLLSPSVCVCFLSFFRLEHQEKRILVPRAPRQACTLKWAKPKEAPWYPSGLWGLMKWGFFCEAPVSLLGEICDSAAIPLPSDAGGTWTPIPSPTEIMETQLSCKLICNYDLGKCSKETQKGLNCGALSLVLIPRQMGQNTSDELRPQTAQGRVLWPLGVKGAATWGVVMGIQPDKYLLSFRRNSHL